MKTANSLKVACGSNRPPRRAARTYDELLQAVKVAAATIDYACGHPSLKNRPAARNLLLLTMRMTILFGKDTDQMTRRQQSSGVRRLNNGTQYKTEALRRATRDLEALGALLVIRKPGAEKGDVYAINSEVVLNWVQDQRERIAPHLQPSPQGDGSAGGQLNYPTGSIPQKLAIASESATDTDAEPRKPRKPQSRESLLKVTAPELNRMRVCLLALQEAFSFHFGYLNAATPANILRAARISNPDISPDDLAMWLRGRFMRRVPWATWGGVVHAVRHDFADSVGRQQVDCSGGATRTDEGIYREIVDV
jgi:hypothetical protein